MGKAINLPNIGKAIEEKLITVGITTGEELVKIGSKQAFEKIRDIDDTACLNMLCALEGAVQNIRWHGLDQRTKEELKQFYKEFNKN